ncbi:hypothetical protein evm_003377 [Chilo suppressalis]|nr:hypothetical protein evm_003377 [Chilo suppressalis]
MFDTEKFIMAVQARPTLWNTDDKSYNNRRRRRHAWDEIAQEFNDNWDTLSDREKDDIVDELHKKWRNLRDYHIKLRKKDKILRRKATYLDLLGFLDVNINNTKKRKRSDTDDDSDDYERHISNTSQMVEEEVKFDIPDHNVIEHDPFQNSILSTTTMNKVNEDPDRSFLMSILPDIQSMNEIQKFKFKLETMKLIDKIKYQLSENS